MLNLFKMDLHRLVRMRSFWIMIAVTVLVACFGVYMTYYDVTSRTVPETAMQPGSDEVVGVYVLTSPQWADRMEFAELTGSMIAGNMLSILCAIFAPIFVNGEQKNGYIKNIAGQLPNRGTLALSKLVAVAVQVAVIFAVFILSSAVSGYYFWRDKMVFETLGDFTKVIGIQYLLHYAFATLVAALTVILRGSGLGMTFGIVSASGTISLLYQFANILLQKCGVSEDFNIGNYAVEYCIRIVNPDLSGSDLTRVIVVGIAFIVASALASVFVMHKRDIR